MLSPGLNNTNEVIILNEGLADDVVFHTTCRSAKELPTITTQIDETRRKCGIVINTGQTGEEGKPKYWKGKSVVITDESNGISQ